MKRIALIRNSYVYDIGGAELFSVNLGKALKSHNFTPFMLSNNPNTLNIARSASLKSVRSPWNSHQDLSGVKILLFPFYMIWIAAVTAWYVFFFLLKRIDVVHPQSRDDFIAGTLAGKLLRKKIVWTDHADLKHIYKNYGVWHKNPIGKLVYACSLLAHHITVASRSEWNLILEALGKKSLPQNYQVTYLGVVDTYKPVKKISDTSITLVATSRMVEAKGISELIEAVKIINNPNVRLVLCGDGPDIGRFKAQARTVSNIEFLGHVDDVSKILNLADIFVHPTHHEGFGLSLVEAAMCGLPIVASNVGSIPEIVKDTISGILVPPKNAEQLSTAIETLVNNGKLRKEMGAAGRKIYLENFQFDTIVKERFLPLYEN